MAQKNDKNEKEQKRHPILDTLESDIAHAYAILNSLELVIRENENCRTSAYVRCRNELQKAYWQIDALNAENQLLHRKVSELKLRNEELMRFRTPDDYMDAVATALAMFPISGPTNFCGVKGISNKTIKKAAEILGIVASTEARKEARQRMQDLGMNDIENRGGHNSKAVEMVMDGHVVATFDSLVKAEKGIGTYNISKRIKSGKTINGVQFRYKNN